MDAGPARQTAPNQLLGRRHTAARAGHAAPVADEQARRELRYRSPARAPPEEPPVATGALERQVAGLTSAVQSARGAAGRATS